ncbi:MAG: helix-turn-helix domain-containing protein [Gemmatimonadetes bacterium]|nr:helix-turn-helix domain-containing protein [Gemmatimonadota bacterium]
MRALVASDRLSLEDLDKAARGESDGRVRTRILSIRYMRQGHSAREAARVFPISDTQLGMWVRRYDAEGLEGLRDRPRPGRPPILDPAKEEAFRERVRTGPAEAEGLAAYRGEDVRRLLKSEFGSDYSISGTYFLLHRLGFSSLVPRPVHPKADPAAQAAFKKGAS